MENFSYTLEDLLALEKDYEAFLDEYGSNRQKAANVIRELALLEGFYLHNLEKALALTNDLLTTQGLTPRLESEAKLLMGDLLLLKGDVWEASLLYSQVDKKMKDEPLGEEARYKNARLSYYMGDFLWSQAQLDILKSATSELVANDALNLSVFITTNLGMDTSSQAMLLYSRADLLTFQNRDEESLRTLDSILAIFPDHMLSDDIYYLKAQIRLKQSRVPEALELLEKVYTSYGTDLLADDALFMLGKLYQNKIGDLQKAMEFYEKILLEYSGSIYVIEARERFRKLRGDKLN